METCRVFPPSACILFLKMVTLADRQTDRQTDRQVDTYLAYDYRYIGTTGATAATDTCAAGAESVTREEDQEEKQEH